MFCGIFPLTFRASVAAAILSPLLVLSGGLDSSSVAAASCCQQQQQQQLGDDRPPVGQAADGQAADEQAEAPKQPDESFQNDEQRLADLSLAALQSEYDRLIVEWRLQLSRMMQARNSFSAQPESESEKWADQFRDGKKKGEAVRKLLGRVAIYLAEKQIAEQPDQALSDGVVVMLSNTLDSYLVFDQLQLAYRPAKVLSELPDAKPAWLAYRGFAAFCRNQFGEAKDYLNRAGDAGFPESGFPMPDRFQMAIYECTPWLEVMEKELAALEADAIAELPRAEIVTTQGSMIVELFEDQAPNTVANFITLAEAKFFDGQQFYDVTENLISSGSPTNDASGSAGYWIKSEFDRPDRRPHLQGYLSLLVVEQLKKGSSQFAIMTVPTLHLNESPNCVFGRIIEGHNVLDLLERAGAKWKDAITAPGSQIGAPDTIISVKILRKRDHAYEPETEPQTR